MRAALPDGARLRAARARGGLALPELLLALALLLACGLPLSQLARGTRVQQAQSRELLALQLLADQVFEEARARVRSGEYHALALEDAGYVEAHEAGREAVAVVTRPGPGEAFTLRVRASGGARRLEFRARVADPLASFAGVPGARGGAP